MFGEDGKKSEMKEIKNLAQKNECFGEVKYENLIQDMKYKALPLLMFILKKRNVMLKTRDVASGGYQIICTDKNDCAPPTPDFHAVKQV